MGAPAGFENWTQAQRDAWATEGARAYVEKQNQNGAAMKIAIPSSAGWPEPKALPAGLLPVASFDMDFLPKSIAPWVGDIADRMQCPPDFVAIPALVALGSVVGRKIGIRPQLRTDWTEVPNMWGLIVGRPGLMKSPALTEALKPLHRLEADARIDNDAAQKEHAKKLALHKIAKDEASKAARKAVKNGGGADIDLDLEEPDAPPERRYIVNDTTYEKLGEILAANPNGTLAFRDELVSLLKTLDREEFAAARGFFLTAWNGTSGYTFDRIIRGKTHIEAACLSLIGGTQPGKIAEYVHRAVSGGASDDGLIQRFGLLVWPDQCPDWKDVDRYPDTEARTNAWRTFYMLDRLDPSSIGAQTDEFEKIPYLRFDEPAHALFAEWRADLEARLRGAEMSPSLESHLAKYRKLVPALALVSHLADGGSGPISEQATLRALALSVYLETHARRAYAAGSEAETAAAKAILNRIRKSDLSDGFMARDLRRKEWSGLTDNDQIKAGLDLLADFDWLRPTISQTGGRPRTTYAINPRAMV